MQRRQTGTRIAFLISLILHLAALLALKDVILHTRVYRTSDTVHVDLVNLPGSKADTPLPRRTVEPIIRPRTRLTGASPGRFSTDRLPERQIVTTGKDIPETDIPTVDTAVSARESLPIPFPSGVSAAGASSQGRGMDGTSGSGRGGRSMRGLAAVLPQRVPVSGDSVTEDLQFYTEHDLSFIKALEKIAEHVVAVRKSRKVDIVFIVDTSESMQDDIDAVRRHLNRMIDRFENAGLDFTLGVVRFHHSLVYEWLGMDITISPQTSNVEEVREVLRSIKVSGGERALDAIMEAISKVKFRPGADRRFILVTDEYVHGTYPVPEVLKAAKRAEITIDVMGMDEIFQRTIAEQTGGIWTPIEKVKGPD